MELTFPYTADETKKSALPSAWANSKSKRLMDVCGAVVLQTAFAVPMLVIAAAVALDSRGDVIFKQKRVGKDGKEIIVYKFRSMKSDLCDPEGLAPAAQCRDPRITRVGAFLRKSRLDELPQLWNVLKGDMSLVGPRPHSANADKALQNMSDYALRLTVKPGMTGQNQTNRLGKASAENKLMLESSDDAAYVTSADLVTDLKLMVKTVAIMANTPVNIF